MKTSVLKLAAASLLAVATQFTLAQPLTDLESLHESSRLMAELSAQLELSEQQRDAIEDIFTDAHEMYALDRAQLASLKDELRVLVDEDFDESAARAIADDIGRLTGTLALARALTQVEVRGVLTEAQFETMEELQQMRTDRQELMREFHRGGYRGKRVRDARREF